MLLKNWKDIDALQGVWSSSEEKRKCVFGALISYRVWWYLQNDNEIMLDLIWYCFLRKTKTDWPFLFISKELKLILWTVFLRIKYSIKILWCTTCCILVAKKIEWPCLYKWHGHKKFCWASKRNIFGMFASFYLQS